jgi:hypothetical protein
MITKEGHIAYPLKSGQDALTTKDQKDERINLHLAFPSRNTKTTGRDSAKYRN